MGAATRSAEFVHALGAEFEVPGAGGFEGFVDVLDIFDAGGVEPLFEGVGALHGVDADAVFPGGAAAEDAVELGTGFGGELEGFDEDGVGDAGGEIDERLVGHGFGVAEVLEGLGAGVGGFAFVGLAALDEGHFDGDLDLEDVDAVFFLAEFGHGAGDDRGLLFGVRDGFFVAAVGVVADELKEKGDVVGAALVADALDPGVLEVVDGELFEWGVVEEDLDAVGAGFFEAADAPKVEEVGEAAGGGGVVAGFFVGEKEAGGVAMLGRGQAVLGVEQDGGGVAGEGAGDEGFEDFEVVGVCGGSASLGEGLLEGASLVHGGGGDDAVGVGYGLEAGEFSWGRLVHDGLDLLRVMKLDPVGNSRGVLRIDAFEETKGNRGELVA